MGAYLSNNHHIGVFKMKTLEMVVNDKLAQWNAESLLQAARYLQQGAKPQPVQFLTGVVMIRVTGADGCQCEISEDQLAQLQANNYKVRV